MSFSSCATHRCAYYHSFYTRFISLPRLLFSSPSAPQFPFLLCMSFLFIHVLSVSPLSLIPSPVVHVIPHYSAALPATLPRPGVAMGIKLAGRPSRAPSSACHCVVLGFRDYTDAVFLLVSEVLSIFICYIEYMSRGNKVFVFFFLFCIFRYLPVPDRVYVSLGIRHSCFFFFFVFSTRDVKAVN